MGCGYESPTEDNQPPDFTPAPAIDGVPNVQPVARPTFVQRPSYTAATPSGHLLPTVQDRTLRGRGSNLSLNIIAVSDKLIPNRKVSVKDRIACYQWTFFTMVSSILYTG